MTVSKKSQKEGKGDTVLELPGYNPTSQNSEGREERRPSSSRLYMTTPLTVPAGEPSLLLGVTLGARADAGCPPPLCPLAAAASYALRLPGLGWTTVSPPQAERKLHEELCSGGDQLWWPC